MSVVIRSGPTSYEAEVTPAGELKVALGGGGAMTADTELPAAAALADAAANPTTPTVGGANLVHNGTTWDRARTATAAAGTTGLGVPAAGALGHDGTNYRQVKTDAAGVVQTAVTNTPNVAITGTPAVTVSGTAAVSGSVTADTELPAAAALADGAANPTAPTVGAANAAYNGTTWDRSRTANAAHGTTGTGVPAAGIVGWDGAAFRRVAVTAAGELSVAGGASTPSSILSGRVPLVTPGTRVPLASNTPCSSVTVKASRNNANTLYLGGVTVAAAIGYELDPGDTASLDVNNVNLAYIDGLVAGDYVTWVAVA